MASGGGPYATMPCPSEMVPGVSAMSRPMMGMIGVWTDRIRSDSRMAIIMADNECNYCPSCQTGGRLLADRGLSRLLKEDWPRSLEELEEFKDRRRVRP